MYEMATLLEDASIRHLDRLYEIEKECFEGEAFTKRQIAQLLTDYNSLSLVARQNDQIVGFIIGTISTERRSLTGHILTIDVSPVHREKGIGSTLLQAVEKLFREKGATVCHLEAREDNTAALKLYKMLGYRKVGKLENYYSNAHGICFTKTL